MPVFSNFSKKSPKFILGVCSIKSQRLSISRRKSTEASRKVTCKSSRCLTVILSIEYSESRKVTPPKEKALYDEFHMMNIKNKNLE